MPKMIDETGNVYGRLTVKGFSHKNTRGLYCWVCECACGKSCVAMGTDLRQGETKSCGCLQSDVTAERNRKDVRDTEHDLYRIWDGMIQRCESKGTRDYERWGAKGVRLCERWRGSFRAFVEDMGERPSKNHSIDRYPDRHGSYEPGNCRWATEKQQAENRDGTHMVKVDGITETVSVTARRIGISHSAFFRWMRMGVEPQQIADQVRRAGKMRGRCLFPAMKASKSDSKQLSMALA